MAAIGVFSDSEGDLEAFDAALKFLAAKGARRFLFAGGNYADLDEWVKWKRDEVRARSDYSNDDFLEDVERFLIKKTLARCDGNAMKAADALGLSRSAFYRRLEKHGL